MPQNKIKSLIPALESLLDFDINIENIIIGGIAANLLGKPRFTADIDTLIFLPEENLDDFLKKAEKYGIIPRIEDALEFAKRKRVFLLKHKSTGVNIDLSLGLLPFEIEVLKRAKTVKISKLKFKLPSVEDLIIMKAVAHRPIDLEDIRNILDVNPGL